MKVCVKILVPCLGLFAIASCKPAEAPAPESEVESKSSEKVVPRTSSCLRWENPTVDPKARPIAGGHTDQQTVAEGLTLLGADGKPQSQFDCAKPTLVYVTGYSPQGVGEYFREPEQWSKKYNILMFRWHRLGFDKNSQPVIALSKTQEASERLHPQLRALLSSLHQKGYQNEVRVVSHSMGGILIAKAIDKMEKPFTAMIKRVELLDPAFPFYDRRPTFWNEMASRLTAIHKSGKKMVVYSSFRSEGSASKLKEILNVQSMSKTWLGGVPSEMHTKIREFYFGSLMRSKGKLNSTSLQISEPFSAQLPTEAIPSNPIHLVQSAGEGTVEISDDIYEAK